VTAGTAMAFIDLAAQRQRLGAAIDDAVARVLEHGRFVMGPEVAELEARLAERSGVAHAVTCSSGTEALVLVLRAWGIGPGDAVVVPAFTFVATAEAVALVGATPVFCDVADDLLLDAAAIAPAVQVARSAGLVPRAVIPVGLFGQPVDEEAVERAAAAAGLEVLGDAAQSYGARFHGRDTAGFGRASTTSFFPAKPLGCYGDGGAIFTDDAALAADLGSLREHGAGAHRYEHVRVGTTARLDTIQAAVLLAKLSIFDEELERRSTVAARYDDALTGLVRTPSVASGRTSTWAQYTIRVPERDRVLEHLQRQGVPAAVHYPQPLHRQPAYAGEPVAGELENAVAASREVLSLPMHPYLQAPDQDRVIAAVRGAVTTEVGAS
jgi:dTDP-4-amino-4,6-dideoxygalactose transaminase